MSEHEHEHDPGCVGIEVRGAYDGVLLWQCSDGEYRNRWLALYRKAPWDLVLKRRYELAEQWIEFYRSRMSTEREESGDATSEQQSER